MALPAGFVLKEELEQTVEPTAQQAVVPTVRPPRSPALPEGFVIQNPAEAFPVEQPAGMQAAAQMPPEFAATPAQRLREISEEMPGAKPSRVEELHKERMSLMGARSQTRAAQELPEVYSELKVADLIPEADMRTKSLVTAGILSATNPEEIGQMLENASPDIGITMDEGGNVIATNNKTGMSGIINRPGLSKLDLYQTGARIAAFTPAGRYLRGPIKTALGASATEAGLQTLEAAAGGEFDTSSVTQEGVVTAATGLLLPKIFGYNRLSPKQRAIVKEMEENPRNPDFAKFAIVKGRPVKTRQLKEAVRQFGDPKPVAVISASSQADKAAFRKMAEIIQKGKNDPNFAIENRVWRVAGDSVKRRIEEARRILKRSGSKIDNIVTTKLKGQNVNVSNVKSSFKESLDKLRVKYDPSTGKVDFEGSALEGQGGGSARDIIERMAIRLKNDVQKAEDLHFAKRLIDQKTAFGAKEGGLEGEIGSAIKSLRRNLNDALREKFPSYKKANMQYSDAIDAVDEVRNAYGSKLDLNDARAIGTKLRSLTNNTASYARMMKANEKLLKVLKDNKVFPKDDVTNQVNVANFLEERFNLSGATTLKSQVGKSEMAKAAEDTVRMGPISTMADRTGKAVGRATDIATGKFKPVNDDNALDALFKILSD